MPYKERKRRRASAAFNLDSLAFMERFSLWGGSWKDTFRDITSREAMIAWYRANCEVFDAIKQPGDRLAGHPPGERYRGWWYTVGFRVHGPRLVIGAECAQKTIQGHLDRWLVPPLGCTDDDERISERWKRGDVASEAELRRQQSVSVPLRDFEDGWETSIQYLDRFELLTDAEREALGGYESSSGR